MNSDTEWISMTSTDICVRLFVSPITYHTRSLCRRNIFDCNGRSIFSTCAEYRVALSRGTIWKLNFATQFRDNFNFKLLKFVSIRERRNDFAQLANTKQASTQIKCRRHFPVWSSTLSGRRPEALIAVISPLSQIFTFDLGSVGVLEF